MKFSIVVATKNAARTLEAAIRSVSAQSWAEREVIVQDGGSTDETLAILKRREAEIDWRAEPDTGVYDAWNKALQRVTGDWVLFLGADDRLLRPQVLAQCAQHLARVPDRVTFAYGGLLLCEPDNARPGKLINPTLASVYAQFPSNMGLPFPATFCRASLFREHAFDSGYAIAGDYAFAASLVTGTNVARLPVPVTAMLRGGMSTSPENAGKLLEERARVLRTFVAPRADVFVNALAAQLDAQRVGSLA